MPSADPKREEYLDPAVLARISDYPLLARTVVEGFLAGLHRSLFHGFGSEFVQYRNYTKGDDLKFVDWKVFARHDRFQTKVFQEETNTNCYLVLEASASLDYQGQRAAVSKLHYAKMIAACLAYLVQRQGDNVGLFAYAENLRQQVPPGHRSDQLHQLLVALQRLETGGSAAHARVLDRLGEQCQRRGLLVYVSDFLDADDTLFAALRRFRLRHHDCLLFQVLDPDEIDLDLEGTTRFIDSESQEEIVTAPELVRQHYREQMQGFLERTDRLARQSDLHLERLVTDQPLAGALAAYLHHRASLR